MTDVDVLVVGGGISGLATAWWLIRNGASVEIWERDTRFGGKIRTDAGHGYTTERAAALVMNFRPEVKQLIAETQLDAAKTVRAPCANRYLVDGGRLVALPMTLGGMFASPLWRVRDRVRLALEPFVPKGGHEWETVSEFITRRLGKTMLEKAFDPYVAGPLASDPDRANAVAALPRLTALEQRYGSLAAGVVAHKVLRRRTACATETFSFQGGMSTLVESLAKTPGLRWKRGCTLTELEMDGRGWRAVGAGRHTERMLCARHVVLSTPAHAAASLLAPLDPELSELLRGIEYAPLCAVHLGLPESAILHPLDGTGFLAPRREGMALNGNLWMSSLFPDRAPAGKALLTSYLGGACRPEAADWDDARTLSAVLSTLEPLLGIRGTPEMVRIDRHRRALPLYHGAYPARMRAIEERLEHLPRLHLVANYRGGISVRDRIVRGHAVARHICAAVGHRPSATPTPDCLVMG